MPSIADRMVPNLANYDMVDEPHTPQHHNLPFESQPSNSSLMSPAGGNRVPMRGILPIEQMSDSDINRFFPYTAYYDRIPKYVYYSLLAQR